MIESPKATIARAAAGASTTISLRKTRLVSVDSDLEIDLADLVPGRDIGGLPAVPVKGGQGRHVGEEEGDGEATEWRDGEVDRVADHRCPRWDHH